jgi:hypothetical protein
MGISDKFRFKIGPRECACLLEGRQIPISLELQKRNPKLDLMTFLRRLSKVNTAIGEYGLRPQSRVRYQRRAFEKDGVRVTIDDAIECQILSPVSKEAAAGVLSSSFWSQVEGMKNEFRKSDSLIVEVKHSGTTPDWISSFLAESGSVKASFSKYCFTLANHIRELDANPVRAIE